MTIKQVHSLNLLLLKVPPNQKDNLSRKCRIAEDRPLSKRCKCVNSLFYSTKKLWRIPNNHSNKIWVNFRKKLEIQMRKIKLR